MVSMRAPETGVPMSIGARTDVDGPLCRFVSAHFEVSTNSANNDAHYGAFPTRTHTCGELRASHDQQQVVLTGWLRSSRQVSKQLGFFTLFDHTGSVQLKVQPTDACPNLLDHLSSIPLQSAILISGTVALRPKQDSKADQSTGAIEILPDSFMLLNPATKDLPFQPSDSVHAYSVSSELRARYRYLDLRRPSLARNIRLRSRITHAVRNHLYDHGFLEIETPILLRSTPEGAREFLVPTRTSSTANNSAEPSFYALPQSPQQPKQLLIASGVTDKYFQIAKCFRDEDGRKDRQPEFTQIDLEMGFVSGGPETAAEAQQPSSHAAHEHADPRDASGQWRIGGHQVRDVIQGLVKRIWEAAGRGALPDRFPVMSYWTAMTRYGSDKPDLRYALSLHDISAGFRSSSEPELPDLDASRVSLEILPYQHHAAGSLSKKELESLLSPFKGKVERFRISSKDNVHELAALLLKKSNLTRLFLGQEFENDLPASEVDVEHLAQTLLIAIESESREADSSEPVDVFVSMRPNPPEGGSTALGDVRKLLAAALCSKSLLTLDADAFTWITEFPLFTLADDDKNLLSSLSSSSSTTASTRWQSSHHPFTAPVASDIPLLLSSAHNPSSIASIRGQHYDLVLNGQEIGGGSVRIHSRKHQQHVFSEILQLDYSEQARFSHLLHALDCGAPPHAGIALGFDRLMAILCGTESIRDVIAFPKQGSGVDPLFGSPAPLRGVDEDQGAAEKLLRMYGLTKSSPSQ
ncbi:hypothetical protein PHSY_002570 [Pseudozyma hubeiensis SY62]|uniref:Aminoacyl-transfer RNA synthetases class-II family profile domain-containing protein n=1 Tax=Pseudozyma hubeiensis (strain SY62) TaxID=1305764 RepID=R9P1J2_PSEHS|nr:hypothetical protein PHSY_002570 [Pseudozyma hubeiensis SY62]GAC94997.1 hypothetical protein PHSY_002570 [Pseudozyma hubeiensis SY62]